jgi:phage gpG-like protein
MPRIVIRTRLSPEQVRRAVAALPALAAGRGAPADAQAVSTAVGLTLLNLVKRAFLVKSGGGTDEAGIKWAAHAPATVARRGKGAPLLRDKGILFNSLSMTLSRPGEVGVGSNVPYAIHAHAKRPLWPDPKDWPSRWWDVMGRAARDALVAVLRRTVGG